MFTIIKSLEAWLNIEFGELLTSSNPLRYAKNLYLNGKKIDYIINGGNGSGQTKDKSVTLNGENTTVTIEKADIK